MISRKHGPWAQSGLHEGELYCTRCLVRSVFATEKFCDPHNDFSDYEPLNQEEVDELLCFVVGLPLELKVEIAREVETAVLRRIEAMNGSV